MLPEIWLTGFQNKNKYCNVAIPTWYKCAEMKSVGRLRNLLFLAFLMRLCDGRRRYICRFTVAKRMQRCIQFSGLLQYVRMPDGIWGCRDERSLLGKSDDVIRRRMIGISCFFAFIWVMCPAVPRSSHLGMFL